MYKKLAAFLITGAMALAFLSGCGGAAETRLENQPKAFSSQAEINRVIENFNRTQNSRQYSVDNDAVLENSADMQAGDYSRTNTQVDGIDEGDIIKNDGRYIYKMQSGGFIIVDTAGETLETVAEIKIDSYIPQELYVEGGTLIMIGGIYKTPQCYSGEGAMPMWDIWFSYSDTDIRIYDISDITEPVLKRRVTVSGTYNTSRLKEGKFYFITNYYFYYSDKESYIPKISDSTIGGGEQRNIPLKNIYYYESVPSYEYMIIGMIDLSAPEGEAALKAYLGLGGAAYMSNDNLYIASADYSSCYRKNLFGVYVQASNCFAKTRIVKIALSDLNQKAIARIDGTIKDRYSLDEYNGYLRVATTVNIWNTGGVRADDVAVPNNNQTSVNQNIYNNVYVLGGGLEIAGRCEKIAVGETIYSVSFNGDKGSLVTFLFTDPYFILDLSDPENPKVSQGLKEDGVSQYLKDIGRGYTIGVGRETETINTAWGIQTMWKGLKVSLYNTGGEEAVNEATPELGDYHYAFAEVFYNPKALLYNQSRGLFGFAAEMWSYNRINGAYYQADNMTQGFLIFGFDTDAETNAGKLAYRGLLTDIDNNVALRSWENYYNNYWRFIKRAVQIGDNIYTISEKYVTKYSFDTLEQTDRLEAVKDEDLYGLY